MADENKIDSLLGLGDEEQTSENEENVEEGNEENKKSPDINKLTEQFDKLQGSYKELQEFARQRSEEVKELKDWRNKITGIDESEKQKETEKLIRERFEEDPLTVINELVNEKVSNLSKTVQTNQVLTKIDKYMGEIDKEYEVNWEKDKEKILSHLEYFSDKAKKERPEDVLRSACRLAGVLKPKTPSKTPSYVEDGTVNLVNQKVVDNEVKNIKKGILGQKKQEIF